MGLIDVIIPVILVIGFYLLVRYSRMGDINIESLFYPDMGRPGELEEEVYKYATIWEIFWSSHRVVLEKRFRRLSQPVVKFDKIEGAFPEKSKIEEYYQKVLVGYEYDSTPFNKYKFICDGYDLETYVIFDDTHKNRVVTSRKDLSEEEYQDYMEKLAGHWGEKVREAKENKKIQERNTKRWVAHIEEHRKKRGI